MKNCTKVRVQIPNTKNSIESHCNVKITHTELKRLRMCQNPWLGLIIRSRVPLNELKKIKRRELTCP